MQYEQSLQDDVFNNEEFQDLLTNSSFMASVEGIDQQQTADCYGLVTGNIPSRDDFPGDFFFTFSLGESTTGGQNWVYSQLLGQLFIGMNKTFVAHFNVNSIDTYANIPLYIRALPVYSSDDFINVPVIRCTMHSADDDPQGQAHQQPGFCYCNHHKFVGHVVRAECKEAQYLYDDRTDRHSVRVPVTGPQPGSERISIPFSFACKTSCPKGMQRRPIHVIFTLEDQSGQVLGRQKLGVKICSCPKRDKKRQEDDYTADDRGVCKKRKRIVNEQIPLPDHPVKVEVFENTIVQKDEVQNGFEKEMGDMKALLNELVRLQSSTNNVITELHYKIKRMEDLHEISHL